MRDLPSSFVGANSRQIRSNLQFLLQDDNNAAVFEDIDPALNNTDLDLEMGYPPSATAVY